MLKRKIRRGFPAAIALGGVAILGLAIAGIKAWPYVKYPDASKRMAASHLDKVSVNGFDYVGESASDKMTVSRFWAGFDSSNDPVLAISYASMKLRRDHPGRESLSRSRFEDELGWLHLSRGDMPCGLTAYQVRKLNTEIPDNLSSDDQLKIGEGSLTLIRVAVTCGKG